MRVYVEISRQDEELFQAQLIVDRGQGSTVLAQATMEEPKAAIDRCLELENYDLTDLIDE